jgi:hypothetical protein
MSINIQLLKEVVKKQAEKKIAANKKAQKTVKTKPKPTVKPANKPRQHTKQHFKKEPLTNLAAELHGKYGKALTGSPANIIDTQPTHKHFRSI